MEGSVERFNSGLARGGYGAKRECGAFSLMKGFLMREMLVVWVVVRQKSTLGLKLVVLGREVLMMEE